VIVPLAPPPAATVCAEVVKTSFEAVAAVIVWDWVAEVSPVAAAETVGEPAFVSPYQNDADDDPAEMDTDVTADPPDEVANTAVPVEFEDRFTVVDPDVVGFPNVSCRCTVNGPNVAVADAAPDTADDVNASFATVAAVTVCTCVPDESPVAAAVTVGEPAFVSPYQIDAEDDPAPIEIDVTADPPDEAANTAVPVELEDRFTVVEPVVVTLPKASRRCTVSGPSVAGEEAAPDTADEVNASDAGAAPVIVCACVADVRPDEDAVIVGAPALVSPYQNDIDDDPAEIDTDATADPPDEAANTAVPVELEDRFTGIPEPAVTGLPAASWRCTVRGPSVAVDDAAPDTADEV
jgi:hypothetical protein